jgi:hypothetical protein
MKSYVKNFTEDKRRKVLLNVKTCKFEGRETVEPSVKTSWRTKEQLTEI